jgi:hypothetical protein
MSVGTNPSKLLRVSTELIVALSGQIAITHLSRAVPWKNWMASAGTRFLRIKYVPTTGYATAQSVGYGLLRSCDLSLLSSVIDLRQLIASRSTHATKEARIRDRNFPTSEIASRFKDLARNGTGNARIKPRRR